MELSQNSQISADPETKGFDLSAGKTWIYPENYPVRDYQFNIVHSSLYTNTLVCLPTGLGKTFIAAVVMYNFWRWYPCGKVVFLAPTKPLVAQQISACHNIMGIPSIETIELTGAVNQKHREVAWSKKRVVFATPQVFQNDLEKNIVPSDLIKCVVIDEAHKALGKHSYRECIRILSERNQNFRVLALSATPGNKIDNVHEILQNLRIAHMELRDETSSDIIPYINQRKIDIILVPLNDQLTEFKDRYIYIMDRHVKVLLQHNVLRGQTANISKGRVFYLLKEYQKKTNKSGSYGQIIKTLNILMTMYHAYELMIRDGLRAFHKFYENHSDKFWMHEETQLQDLLDDIQTYLGPFPEIKSSCNQSIGDIPQNLVFGHTKFEKLRELLVCHFKNYQEKQSDTRAIVFVEYRDIVSEVYVLLLQCQPLIRPQMFVGQSGQKQKQQIKALVDFRSNHVNVLISTSIGEEGLDVGEVDLIICFDISQHSPTRLVQRMGRTGRKRDGHIIILVTDGREHETLRSTMARRDSLNNKILNTSNVTSSLYQDNPRMIPDGFTPECLKMHLSMQPKTPITKGRKKKEKMETKTNKRKNTIKKVTAIESKVASQNDGGQFSMMKFFKSDKHEEHKSSVLEPQSLKIETHDVHPIIKPSDVKILSCDDDAVDFLTVCALRTSEREASADGKRSIDKSYVPKCAPIKNFFNFSIPNLKILDCLITLSDPILKDSKKINLEDNHSANDSDGNHSYNNNDDECVMIGTIKEIVDLHTVEESKFEYLLDDSSASNTSNELNDIEEVAIENNNPTTSLSYLHADVLQETKKDTNALEDLEPSKFEDLLNETTDDSENDAPTHIRAENPIVSDSTNDENVKTFTNLKIDDDMKVNSAHFQEVEDISVQSDQSKHDVHDYKEKKNTSKTQDQSMLSVTQAIIEIRRIKSNLDVSVTAYESEDDLFEDDIVFPTQIDSEVNFVRQIESVDEGKESNDTKDPSKSAYFADKKSAINTELKIDEFEWGDDFDIIPTPVENCAAFDTSKKESEKLKKIENKVEDRYSDSDEWFSVKKSCDTMKKNVPRKTTIAKKLANMKKCNSKKGARNEVKPESDLVTIKGNKRDELEASYFFNEQEDHFVENKDPRENVKHFERPTIKNRNRSRRPRRARSNFLDDEAEVSSTGDCSTDESSGVDQDLEDFVSYTQNVHDTSDMHAVYLQTVRSPIKRCNGFLFKEPRAVDPDVEIYSQEFTQANDSYLDDSFCVAEGDVEEGAATSMEELCELEKAELELKKRKRKRARGEKSEDHAAKRTRKNKRANIINYSASSEDETEKLREQIKDESFLLARSNRNN
ncbi:Fanconi anemia group M protein [Hylaeus anthracinus]|uniref:Fanconi anemia group M protein n=1 Tax=Hylaeus anthracinus TaxID=313031 RepID=UPI0023BA0E0B|nr:Fanconi anemia group M protein [Hylaeus anthracinus]